MGRWLGRSERFGLYLARADGSLGWEPLREIELIQVAEARFALGKSFIFRDSSWGDLEIDRTRLQWTDLASVPRPMQWFASRHGSYTAAVLLHDQLCASKETWPNRPHSGVSIERDEVDDVFFEAMEQLDVNFVVRRMLFAAVVFWTRLSPLNGSMTTTGSRRFWTHRLPVITWTACGAVGTVIALLVILPCVSVPWAPDWQAFIAAALAPIPAALLWGKRRAGAAWWAAAAIPMICVPSLACFVVQNPGATWRWLFRRRRPVFGPFMR